MKKLATEKILIIFIIILSLIPLRSLLPPGMFNSHDSEIHIVRLANFYKSLTEGNIFPRWGINLNNKYGHPTLMFLYPLPNYFGSFILALGFSLINTVKILFAVGFILSGVFMFLFLKDLFGRIPAVFGSIIYLFSPYRFVDIYVRGALPEHLFFTLAPLSIFFFLRFLNKSTKLRFITVCLSLALLILVHNASSFIFFPFLLVFLFVLKLPFQNKQKTIKFLANLIFPFIVSTILASFYWFPALWEGKYTLRNLIINKQFSVSHLTTLKELLIPSWGFDDPRFKGGLSLQIGLFNIAIFVIFIFLILIKKIKITPLSSFIFVSIIFSVFLMTTYSKSIWESNNILFNIHFPWRFLVLIVFISGILAAFVSSTLFPKKTLIVFIASFVPLLLTFNYQTPSGYFYKDDHYFLNEYGGTGDNGESSPIWSTLTPTGNRKGDLEVIEGKVEIISAERKSEVHKFQVLVESEKARLVDNTVYFPGWTLYDNKVDVTKQIEFQDPEFRGLITFWLPKGEHELTLIFKNTKVRELSSWVSIATLLLLFLLPKHLFGHLGGVNYEL